MLAPQGPSALFVITSSYEAIPKAITWRHYIGPVRYVTFEVHGPPQDEEILKAARKFNPDVVMYYGVNEGAGKPSLDTLKKLKKIAPLVHYQGDLEDESWWPQLEEYKRHNIFDLTVGMTGVDVPPYTDFSVVTAVSLKPFIRLQGTVRNRLCGFGGTFHPRDVFDALVAEGKPSDPRSHILHGLDDRVDLRVRTDTSYQHSFYGYIRFMLEHEMIVNTSWTGSFQHHHVKTRVIETAWAHAALIENRESPTAKWFPKELYYQYDDAEEILRILDTADDRRVRARRFRRYALDHYHPEKIYGQIIDRLKTK